MLNVEKALPAVMLGELKAHLRIEDSVEDAILAAWILVATEMIEAELGQLLIEREVMEIGCAREGAMRLVKAPVRILEELQERSVGGEWAVVAAKRIDFSGGLRPCVRLSGAMDGTELRARYRAGIADGWQALPELLRHAVVRLAAHFFAHRDGPEVPGMPRAVRQMLASQRARRLI